MCHCSGVNDYDEDEDKDEDGSSAKRMKMTGDDEDDDYLLEVSTYTMYSAYDKEWNCPDTNTYPILYS